MRRFVAFLVRNIRSESREHSRTRLRRLSAKKTTESLPSGFATTNSLVVQVICHHQCQEGRKQWTVKIGKYSLVCLDGQSMTPPCQGNTIPLRYFQQLNSSQPQTRRWFSELTWRHPSRALNLAVYFAYWTTEKQGYCHECRARHGGLKTRR